MAGGIAGALGGAAANLGAGFLGNKLFGGDSPPQTRPLMINAGGLTSALKNDRRIKINRSQSRDDLITGLRALFSEQADEFGNLRGLVRPGVGALTEARINTLENRGGRRISNLRDNLARRSVLGSSFGQAQIQSEERQLDQDIAEARAESFLQELDLTTQFIQQEYASDIAGLEAELQGLDFEVGVSLGILGAAQDALNRNSAIQTQLAINNAEGIGGLIGDSGIGDAVSDAIKGLF